MLGSDPHENEVEIDYDSRFRKKFGLRETSEVVIKEYPCILKPNNLKSKLYISQNYLCLFSDIFKLKKKVVVPLKDLQIVNLNESDLVLTPKNGKKIRTIRFHSVIEADEAAEVLENILDRLRDQESSSNPSLQTSQSQLSDSSSGLDNTRRRKSVKLSEHLLSSKDWQLLLNGAKSLHFNPGEVILKDNEDNQKLYQITKGSVAIRKMLNGSEVQLSKLDVKDIFGEISIIEGQPTCASIVAEEEVELQVIEGYFLRLVFDVYPGLAGRFYLYLASILAKRFKRLLDKR